MLQVALRNSQNALYTSTNSIKRALEASRPSCQENLNNTSTPSLVTITASTQTPQPDRDEQKKPLYTTSIYINSAGEVDIETRQEEPSPVLSAHRVNGIKEDEDDVVVERRNVNSWERREPLYRTTAAVHRYSDGVDKSRGVNIGGLNFVSLIVSLFSRFW